MLDIPFSGFTLLFFSGVFVHFHCHFTSMEALFSRPKGDGRCFWTDTVWTDLCIVVGRWVILYD